jgi:hypothetical protein
MEESLRRTAYQNNQFRFNNFQQGNNNQTLIKNKSRDTLINNQKRQKLKNALMDRFQRIFGANANFNIINYEVENFLSQTNLTENDLRILEANLRKKLNIPFESKTNRNKSLNPNNNKTKKNRYNNTNKLRTQQKNLSNNINLTVNNNNTTNKIFNPFSNTSNNIINDNESKNSNTIILPSIGKKKRGFWDACDPNESRMSGGSDIDNFNEVRLGDKLREQEMKDFEKIAENKEVQKKKKKNQIDYSKYADEWDAINMYNKKMFEEQKRLEKIKDYQVKQRVKKELDNQIKQKIKKEYEQKLKDEEFDLMEKKHLKKIEELEKQKAEKVKALVIKEKEERDKQLKDQYIRKRIDILKNKKYERELVEQNKKDILEDKKAAKEKKEAEKRAMEQTIKDNELRKKILEEQAKKEKEDDIQIMKDHAAVEERKENERRAYFNRIERNANSFMDSAINTVLREQREKEMEEEEQLRKYNEFKEKMEAEDEYNRLKRIKEGKVNLRNYLDKQVAYKKLQAKKEHEVDVAQGKVWDKDVKIYNEHEKEVKKIIREMNIRNLKALDEQVKMGKQNVDHGMSESEKAMNRDILEKAYEME